jgi:hypothetical protein
VLVRIVGLKKYQRKRGGRFDDLPWPVRQDAEAWLWHFYKRWRGNLPQWRRAILQGQARRLALNPPSSEWGRKMLAKRGGLAVQRMYQLEGRNPTAAATKIRQTIRKARKSPRVAYLPLV